MALKLYLTFPYDSFEELVEIIGRVQEKFRPIYFSFTDRIQSRNNLLSNDTKLAGYLEKAKRFSSTLLGEKIAYNIYPTTFRDEARNPTHGFLMVETKKGFKHNDQLDSLLKELVEVSGVQFGYVSTFEEAKHRNRVIQNWSNVRGAESSGTIEFQIGIDFRKYITGLYWLSIFSDEYLTGLGFDINLFEEISSKIEKFTARDGTKFYACYLYVKPEDWVSESEKVDSYISATPRIFSKQSLNDLITQSKSDNDLQKSLSEYIL